MEISVRISCFSRLVKAKLISGFLMKLAGTFFRRFFLPVFYGSGDGRNGIHNGNSAKVRLVFIRGQVRLSARGVGRGNVYLNRDLLLQVLGGFVDQSLADIKGYLALNVLYGRRLLSLDQKLLVLQFSFSISNSRMIRFLRVMLLVFK